MIAICMYAKNAIHKEGTRRILYIKNAYTERRVNATATIHTRCVDRVK
jgi:hypothetical protein